MKKIMAAVAVVVILIAIYAIAMYASFTNSCSNRGRMTSAGTCTVVKTP